ncbi:MAG: S8 family serine peptidase [bacterium]|nr:S8 family serine peptidase [bacterium]
MSRRLALFLLVLAVPALSARARPVGGDGGQTALPTGRIVVKLSEASGVTFADAGPRAATPDAADRVARLLERAAPGFAAKRLFPRDAGELAAERAAARARDGRDLPDLNAYAVLESPRPATRDELLRIVAALRADPAVATAYLEPKVRPAGRVTPAAATAGTALTTTTDFSGLQGYLGAPPTGINALAVAAQPGGRGAGVRVIDVEGAWQWTHEDLTPPVHVAGGSIQDQEWRNHGTATLGVIRGADNGLGVRGVAPSCLIGGVSIHNLSTSAAVSNATGATAYGDIILIELQGAGPNANGAGDYGYIPMEYWQDTFDAVSIATALGRTVVAVAGNGLQDLDDPVYAGLFDPGWRDSGAILVGAGEPATLEPEWFTNHGARVDLQAWGEQVASCGYGDLQGSGFPENAWYTQSFNGTSSASAVLAGAAAVLQGLTRAQFGYSLDPRHLRGILVTTGTPQAPDPAHVGPRPDLAAAWERVTTGVGNVNGRVIDSQTQLPVAGVGIAVQDGTTGLISDSLGRYSYTSEPGPATFLLDDYHHAPESFSAILSPGAAQVHDVVLQRLPQVTVSGRVQDEVGTALGAVRVELLGTPLPPVDTFGDGVYSLPDVAAGRAGNLLFHRKPGYGARTVPITPQVLPGNLHPLFAELPRADETFTTPGGFAPMSTAWAWGIAPSGPDSCFSMPGCWGVGYYGDYDDNQYSTLTSPVYAFPGAGELHLSFHIWCDTEPGYDGARLELLQGAEWIVIEPVGGYDYASVAALGGAPGWSGRQGDWRGVVFDLAGRDLSSFRFRLLFRADESTNYRGFFIDDVSFDAGNTFVDVGAAPPAPPRLAAHPNPFNPRTTVRWEAPAAGLRALEVFDARGRRVRRLAGADAAAAGGEVVWDGMDDDGRAGAAGVYLVRLLDLAGASACTRVTLVR